MSTVPPPEVTKIGAVTVIRPGKDFESLYGHMMEQLAPSLQLAESVDPPLLIMDLRNVKYIGSLFLGTIVTASKAVSSKPQGRFALCELSSFCKAAVSVSKLEQILEIYDTVADAVEALSKPR